MGLALVFFLPSYLLVAGFMTAIASVSAELRQAQQIAGFVTMLFTLPVFFIMVFVTHPDHPLLTAMTFFPTTSMITVLLRWAVSDMPGWQVVAAWLILFLSAVGSLWFAGRAFRIGMLRYGQRIRLRSVIQMFARRGGEVTLSEAPRA
ncbi:MAG TPA: ABC transporter permease [Chloroflexi bacterium]|nr:ABC transporter permease [Chloroflexota bacterium]